MLTLRRILGQNQLCSYRNYATAFKLIETAQDDKTGISVISMARPPVNSLNLELLSELKLSLIEAKKNNSRGVILTSSLPGIFSAGLDIMEMYKPDKTRLIEFWRTLQDTWITLYGLEIPTAAAVNGASPAGGCMLAISCEYRVFVDGKHTMGLNETRLGLMAPKWFRDTYIATVGYRAAELMLLRGTLLQPKEALKIGLVDELATDKADATKKCEDYILYFNNILPGARITTKTELRTELINWLKENRQSDIDIFVKVIETPKVQATLEKYIESLKQKGR